MEQNKRIKPVAVRWIVLVVAAAAMPSVGWGARPSGAGGSSDAGAAPQPTTTPQPTDQAVALRIAGAKYLKATPDGTLKAERFCPTSEEVFQLVPRDGGEISLKTAAGRVLVFDAPSGGLRAAPPTGQPGRVETFTVVPAEGNRVALKPHGLREFVAWEGPADARRGAPGGPRPTQTVELFHAVEMPAAIRTSLASLVDSRLSEELAGKSYDQVRSRKNEKFIELPDPTLRDPLHTKSVRVFSTVEEYRIQARLDGKSELQITNLAYLIGYQDRGVSMLLVAVRARLPVQGRVSYKLPNVVSAGCGYRAVAAVTLVGEVRMAKSDETVKLQSPELRELHVQLTGLQLSNDVLNISRDLIEDLINHEIRKSEDKIRDEANRSLAKAVQAQEFNVAFLRFLGIP